MNVGLTVGSLRYVSVVVNLVKCRRRRSKIISTSGRSWDNVATPCALSSGMLITQCPDLSRFNPSFALRRYCRHENSKPQTRANKVDCVDRSLRSLLCVRWRTSTQ